MEEVPTRSLPHNPSLPIVTPVKGSHHNMDGCHIHGSSSSSTTSSSDHILIPEESLPVVPTATPEVVVSAVVASSPSSAVTVTVVGVSNTTQRPSAAHLVTMTTTTTTTNSPSVSNNSPWKQATTVHAELAALKQRGLAKILNKHFTATAHQLGIEKAAADAALLDLQQRKARTSAFPEHGYVSQQTELSPLDQACIKANQWRAECRRKERETLLLYQRYVHKFGSTTVLPLPMVNSGGNGSGGGGGDTKTASWSAGPTKTTPVPVSSSSSQPTMMGVVVPTAPSQPPPPPSSTLVPSMAAQIESTLEEYCARGAVPHPSIITHGTEQTYSSVAAKEELAFRDYYRKQLEAKGADAICSPGFYKGDGTFAVDHVGTRDNNNNSMTTTTAAAAAVTPNERDADAAMTTEQRLLLGVDYMDYYDDDDVCSMVSGLTTLHSAMTREFLHDCENSVQTFLREEQANIQKILDDEGSNFDASSDTHLSNAAVQDSDATAKAAESMVQQMQDILQEYQNRNATTTDANPVAITAQKTYPRTYPTGNDNEEWMVYYDEFYRQEYYHEIHTNRTQWDPPMDRDASYSHSSSTDVFSVVNGNVSGAVVHDDLYLYDRMDSIMENNDSRVRAYRRRQRRKRRRRRAILAVVTFLTCLLVTLGYYYWQCHYEVVENKPVTCTTIETRVAEQWHRFTTVIQTSIPQSMETSEPVDPPQHDPVVVEVPSQCVRRFVDEVEIALRQLTLHQQEQEEYRLRQDALLRRPWGCNIPFAYLFHSRCRRLAHQNPAFDLHALINSMLQ
jgi:hypothetical protein